MGPHDACIAINAAAAAAAQEDGYRSSKIMVWQ
jgi:hypothetical protein